MIGTTKDKDILFKIDNEIDNLVKEIEVLAYVNPINIESEKALFFKSKCTKNPKFIYPNINFNAFELHKRFFNLPIDQINDSVLYQLYKDVIYDYMNLIECIDTIGKGKDFYYNCLKAFGTPTEENIKNAKFILHFDDEKKIKIKSNFTVDEAISYFKNYSKKYSFTYCIKKSDTMAASAMVLNNEKTLLLSNNHTYTQHELQVLANHEIGVHMVTTMNGLLHKLKIFSHGFPRNIETQEGLAVFSEYMSGNLTVTRLKELAYRVLASDSLAKGFDFKETYKMLKKDYNISKNKAFYISLRAHRGGGYTKDYLYLCGLKKIYNLYKKGTNLDNLLLGKVSLEYAKTLDYLIEKDLAVKPKYKPFSFKENKNTNTSVNFILDHLK